MRFILIGLLAMVALGATATAQSWLPPGNGELRVLSFEINASLSSPAGHAEFSGRVENPNGTVTGTVTIKTFQGITLTTGTWMWYRETTNGVSSVYMEITLDGIPYWFTWTVTVTGHYKWLTFPDIDYGFAAWWLPSPPGGMSSVTALMMSGSGL